MLYKLLDFKLILRLKCSMVTQSRYHLDVVRFIILSDMVHVISIRWSRKHIVSVDAYYTRDQVMISHNNYGHSMVSWDCNYVTYYRHVGFADVVAHCAACTATVHDNVNAYLLHSSLFCSTHFDFAIRLISVSLELVTQTNWYPISDWTN